MIHGHGDDIYAHEQEIRANFSSNVFYEGCNLILINKLKETLNYINNYPSPIANELNISASKFFGINQNSFLFTNGATEAFYLIAQLFKGKNAAIVCPTFAEYEDACKIHNLEVSLVNRKDLNNLIADCVFICNPNNPDGYAWNIKELWDIIQLKQNTHFVIDEAYIEFTNSTESLVNRIDKTDNLTVVKSLTKAFAIPGLRLGYVVSNQKIIQQLTEIKMPWSVNSLAINAGKFIYENFESLIFNLEKLLKEKNEFSESINKIKGFKSLNSSTSYFLVELENGKAKDLKKYLLEEWQILVRDATNFKLLNGEYIRVSVQNKIDNQLLLKALKKWNIL